MGGDLWLRLRLLGEEGVMTLERLLGQTASLAIELV